MFKRNPIAPTLNLNNFDFLPTKKIQAAKKIIQEMKK